MATLSSNTPSGVHATGLPANEKSSFAPRITRETRFLHLLDQRRLIDLELTEPAASFDSDPAGGPRLPKSGLRIVTRNGVTLAKGGRADG